jgi:DNA repair protein RadC
MTIHSLPAHDKPRERLQALGADALSSSELIAIILGSGTKGSSVLQLSQEIIAHFGSLPKLIQATVEELQQIRGLGTAKAIQLKAALTLGKRAFNTGYLSRCKIQTPEHAYRYVKDDLQHETREILLSVLLDTKGTVIAKQIISIGTLSNTLVHPREVFYFAIRHKAASLVLAHNHPSGDPTPSQADIEMTSALIKAGELLGIPLQDHLIVGARTFVSLREVGVFQS